VYGLVNKALAELVEEEQGTEGWARVCARAGTDVDMFISTEQYPDSLTFDLVGAASEELRCPVARLLQRFGRHWVLFTGRKGYGLLMEQLGRSVTEFMLNLPGLHARVALLFPHLQPPTFRTEMERPGVIRVHYLSTREGFAPMVDGLLHGVGEMLGESVQVTQVADRATGAPHDEFLVELEPA